MKPITYRQIERPILEAFAKALNMRYPYNGEPDANLIAIADNILYELERAGYKVEQAL